jgi:hypothetical protein
MELLSSELSGVMSPTVITPLKSIKNNNTDPPNGTKH